MKTKITLNNDTAVDLEKFLLAVESDIAEGAWGKLGAELERLRNTFSEVIGRPAKFKYGQSLIEEPE